MTTKTPTEVDTERRIAVRLIAQLDAGLATKEIDKAIEELKNIKHVRLNVPF